MPLERVDSHRMGPLPSLGGPAGQGSWQFVLSIRWPLRSDTGLARAYSLGLDYAGSTLGMGSMLLLPKRMVPCVKLPIVAASFRTAAGAVHGAGFCLHGSALVKQAMAGTKHPNRSACAATCETGCDLGRCLASSQASFILQIMCSVWVAAGCL